MTGALYQLSNQITLGLSEREAVENLQNIANQLIQEERKARKVLLKNIAVLDRIGRSAGVIRGAKVLSCEEYMKLISNVRLGLAEGVLSGVPLEDVNALTAAVQPATLTAGQSSSLTAAQRDIARAEMVREAMQGLQ